MRFVDVSAFCNVIRPLPTVLVTVMGLCGQVRAVEASSQAPASDGAAAPREGQTKSEPSEQKSAERESGDEQEANERRKVTVRGSKTALYIRDWPLLGNPDARYVFVEMFDYTCPHCRATHKAVHGAMQRFGDDLGIIALPVPLHRSCNSAVRSGSSKHADACEVARIAIALWRVNPRKFDQFHSWLFEPARGRTATAARRHAAKLVGEKALRQELAKPWAGKYIAAHVKIYRKAGAGSVPKLMFPKTTVVGEVTSTSSLVNMIERYADTK